MIEAFWGVVEQWLEEQDLIRNFDFDYILFDFAFLLIWFVVLFFFFFFFFFTFLFKPHTIIIKKKRITFHNFC